MKIEKKISLNKSDFRKRIVSLWQDQKENEIYDLTFEDRESENEFNKLIECFNKVNGID